MQIFCQKSHKICEEKKSLVSTKGLKSALHLRYLKKNLWSFTYILWKLEVGKHSQTSPVMDQEWTNKGLKQWILWAALSCDDNRRERQREREREREREMCDDHSVGFLLPTWCKSKLVPIYLLLLVLYFVVTHLFYTLFNNGSWRLLLPISGSSESFGCSLHPIAILPWWQVSTFE